MFYKILLKQDTPYRDKLLIQLKNIIQIKEQFSLY